MNDRQHVWHDPSYPPNPVITEDRMKLPSPRPPKRAAKALWIMICVALAFGLVVIAAGLGSAVVAGFWEGLNEPMMPAAFTTQEEEAVRGLAAAIADRGKRGDFESIIEMGDGSEHLNRSELADDVSEAFSDFTVKDWGIDYENAQVLIDQESGERILVFRIVLTGTDDTKRATNPFYAVDAEGKWRLTGIGGRDVVEDVY